MVFLGGGGGGGMRERETNREKRRLCWESVFPTGIIEGLCPVCRSSQIRFSAPCGTTFQKLHIQAKSKGGSDASWNLLPGCGCNNNMFTHNLLDWMGTRGNRKELIKPLFLSKYKSIVPPIARSPTNREQLIDWIQEQYQPELMELYQEWLILKREELSEIGALLGEGEEKEERRSPHFSHSQGSKRKRLLSGGKPTYFTRAK